GSANFTRNAISILRCRELEDQNQMSLIDLRDTSRERACIDHELHPIPRRLDGRFRHWFTQTEVVDDDVQHTNATPWDVCLLGGHSASLAQARCCPVIAAPSGASKTARESEVDLVVRRGVREDLTLAGSLCGEEIGDAAT